MRIQMRYISQTLVAVLWAACFVSPLASGADEGEAHEEEVAQAVENHQHAEGHEHSSETQEEAREDGQEMVGHDHEADLGTDDHAHAHGSEALEKSTEADPEADGHDHEDTSELVGHDHEDEHSFEARAKEDAPPAHDHASTAHDHATDHGQPAGIGRAVRFVGKFHPVVVHFPIALILAAALAEVFAMRSGKSAYSDVAFFALVIGAIGAAAAVGLGWAAGAFAEHAEQLRGIPVLGLHRWLGTVSGALILLTLGLALKARKAASPQTITVYRASLFASAILVSVTGHFGSSLIYGLGHFFN